MQHESELTDWKPTPPGALDKSSTSKMVTYESSLIGEYARLLLLLLIVPLAIWFANDSLRNPTGVLCLVASLVVFSSLVTSRGYQVIRFVVVALMTANVLSFAISPDDISGIKNSGLPKWSVFLLLFCLIVAVYFETAALVKSSPRAGTLLERLSMAPAMRPERPTPG